ncbi:MAG: LacI family DNA-binding transcriptional regulator, partial [Actinomycetota bacterium]
MIQQKNPGRMPMAERSTRRVTLADVAEAAGMSKSAVSMILNDRPGTRL